MKRINQSKILFWGGAFFVFGIMLFLNALTMPCADDFVYMYSFSTGERIQNFFDIFPSMVTHYKIMNGRVYAHFLVQFFLMINPWTFKILNSLVFVGLGLTMYKICNGERDRNNLLLLWMFSSLWIFTLAFGQVYLWLDGACNYLWAMFFCLLFIYPYTKNKSNVWENKGLTILFAVFSFFAGGYNESISLGAIATAFFLCISRRKSIGKRKIISLAFSLLGYVFMMLAPSERINKSGEFSLISLSGSFETSLKMYLNFSVILASFLVLLTVRDLKNRRLALSFFFGSLVSNFILTLAVYYPERSACFPCVLLIVAVTVLFNQGKKAYVSAVYVSSVLVMLLCAKKGGEDVILSHRQYMENHYKIINYGCKEEIIYLPSIDAATRYSFLYDLKYLDTSDPYSWPNKSMADYYRVKGIVGK